LYVIANNELNLNDNFVWTENSSALVRYVFHKRGV